MSISTLLFGRRLANREAEGRKIGAFEGVPAMGLDGLGSASYGPEAMLAVLAVVGAAGLGVVQPVTWAIVLLLAIVFFSYRQTIAAYPASGGSYTVARENLGLNTGLVAAAALMVDYMLNVAVGISAGVGALTSALPALHAYTLPLCLGILAIITVVNLRGTKESGLALALPTYLFIGSLFFILGYGVWRSWSGHAEPVVPPPGAAAGEATEAVTLWLIVRAFAAGCTAMTGVEAVSNGVSAFREPTVKHAHRTLTAIVVVLGTLLLGIAHLAQGYGILAMNQEQDGYQSVVSQVVGAVWGRDWLYYVTIGSVLAVLCLSANTSFVGFPRVCRQVAEDGYLPRAFALPGRRLVYTAGILFLAVGAGALLAVFGGITDRLIPLFAVGAFLSFTLSQAGMAQHWRRSAGGRADRTRLGVNGLGALATGLALIVILAAKFTEGAWLTVVVIPLTFILLRAVRRYYSSIESHILPEGLREVRLVEHQPPVFLVPLMRWDRLASRAVHAAVRLSPDVVALHLENLNGPDAGAEEGGLREEWRRQVELPARRAGVPVPRLIVEASPYRSLLAPTLRTMEALRGEKRGRPVVVVLSEFVGGRWWEVLMHTHRTKRLRRQLLRHGGPDLAVLILPWQLEAPETEEVLTEEEPVAAG
ncbi:APC family permease [Roseomonas nepalensis]|uniref:APC family permease n=1 Tax=Muricoccus nepalensis TaxID=1854500 RepID=A0A502FIV0_9PROT|nr:APC family permease [Roseomonas nepalensis]TPG49299.1 APC family permease [Roseomonas nepalensis]